MKISQSAREAAAKEYLHIVGAPSSAHDLSMADSMVRGDLDHWAIVQAIAAAEARGEERMQEKAAKCAADVILRARTGDIDTDLRSIGYILQGDIRALPIGEE